MFFRALSLSAILATSSNIAAAQRCPQEIEVGGNSGNIYRWEVVSTSPLTIRQRVNNQQESYTGPDLRHQAEFYNEKVSSCGRGVPGWCQSNTVNEQREIAKFLACHLAAPGSGRDSEEDVDIITPSVPGCPKYLRKSLVEWRRKPGSNPQLNIWQVRNVSNRILKVAYRVNGANNDPGTLNPGDSAEVWQLSEEPPYVVRDFNEVASFSRNNPQQKSLQCNLAIRPK